MTFYQKKDKDKFKICNKLISRGAAGTSSRKYSIEGVGKIKPKKVNCKKYKITDVVGVSVNGACYDRETFDHKLLQKAITAQSTIIADTSYHAQRNYNVGERELIKFLKKNDYERVKENKKRSVWRLKHAHRKRL